jgi:hypothetical protein
MVGVGDVGVAWGLYGIYSLCINVCEVRERVAGVQYRYMVGKRWEIGNSPTWFR